jgi:DNA-binding NarL/FixJ family response regulator
MKILIIEDHPLFIEGLRLILDDLVEAAKVLSANHAKQAMAYLESDSEIGLILLDLGLPDIDGRALMKIIRGHGFKQPVLVVTGSENIQLAQEMIRADAQGYVLKSSALLELRKAVKEVLAGQLYVPEEWRGLVSADKANSAGEEGDLRLKVTDRQLDVLYLMAQGHQNKVIADWLGVSEHTVKTHVQALFETFGVKNRTACVREAEKLGLLLLS